MSTHPYPYDLILFDLDGTLIETSPEIADAVNDTLAEIGLAPVEQARVDRWIGHGTRELLIQALAFRWGRPAEAVRQSDRFAAIEALFGQHYQRRCGTRSHLYPQVRQTLQALRACGVKLAVVTNKEGRYTQAVLDAHAMAPLFDRVISGDTLPVKNPTRWRLRTACCGLVSRPSVVCSWATPPSTWPPRAMPGSPSGRCPMATTWASRSSPATPTA